MTFSWDCLIADLALEMGKSRTEFYEQYDQYDRAQLVATYQSKMDRNSVRAMFPVPTKRKKGMGKRVRAPRRRGVKRR